MDYKKYNDYELLYMIREKDDFSGDVLYRKYQPLISKIASDYYNRFHFYGYDYEDFCQEGNIAFQKAVLCYDELKNNKFYTFVLVCVHRRLLSFCRKISNAKKNIPNFDLINIDDCIVADEKCNISTFFQNLEIDKYCHNTILNTDFDVSSVFELKLNGFSLREIEILLEIPISSVEYKYRCAKKYLQKLISSSIL